MPKAINWPQQFYEEVLSENSDSPKIALRLGSLYFDNGYYVPDEIVDIRVDHRKVRKARIIEDLRLTQIKDLSDDTLKLYKKSLREKSEITKFLQDNYNQPVNEETQVTVITYQNLSNENDDLVDDPHV